MPTFNIKSSAVSPSRLTMMLQKYLFAPTNKTIDPYAVRSGLDDILSDKYSRGKKNIKAPLSNPSRIESTKVAKIKPYAGPFKETPDARITYNKVPRVSTGLFDELRLAHNKEYDAKIDSINKNSSIDRRGKSFIKPKDLQLTSGRYNLGRVNPNIISSLVSAAKRQGVNPNLMVALAGRESTFDTSRYAVKGGSLAGHKTTIPGIRFKNSNEMKNLVSGWTVQDPYLPRSPENFLADKKVPGIETFKSKEGIYSAVINERAVNRYLKDNPRLMNQYLQSMKKTKNVKRLNNLDMAAQKIKNEGLAKYNPGDKQYVDKVRQDYKTLKADPAMSKYLTSLGVNTNIGFKRGGLLY